MSDSLQLLRHHHMYWCGKSYFANRAPAQWSRGDSFIENKPELLDDLNVPHPRQAGNPGQAEGVGKFSGAYP
jgi:hypothetical protein